ncbi:MAG: hypothetical protein H6838_06645 [Planctomycetes bacterium]|nr:hypothetical protein [Planctomycetota bacterium]MCB9885153.1 hypothetical protein [Planctomycetota bacterium]
MDTYEFLADPRVLPLAERRDLATLHAVEQAEWLDRLSRLAEPAVTDPDFPAFLLALPPFADLGRRIGAAQRRIDLSTEIADELDWFVRAFADYLHTDQGEDAFAGERRR